MHFYNLYGIRLKSQLALPFSEAPAFSRFDIHLNETTADFEVRGNQAPEASWFHHARLEDDSDYVRWRGMAEFLISPDGRKITGRSAAGAPREAFYSYFLGQVLSYSLLKMGIEPLHATAVVVDGQAVVFMGDCGAGKSSLGAVFLRAGYSILTDDLLVLQNEGGGFLAYPGPPRIKLFPEMAAAYIGEAGNGTPMNHLTPKLIIPLTPEQAHGLAVPLAAIYILDAPPANSPSRSVTIRHLSRRHSAMQLIANTFNTVIRNPERLKRQFQQASQIAAVTPVKTLSYCREHEMVSLVLQSILRDLDRVRSKGQPPHPELIPSA